MDGCVPNDRRFCLGLLRQCGGVVRAWPSAGATWELWNGANWVVLVARLPESATGEIPEVIAESQAGRQLPRVARLRPAKTVVRLRPCLGKRREAICPRGLSKTANGGEMGAAGLLGSRCNLSDFTVSWRG